MRLAPRIPGILAGAAALLGAAGCDGGGTPRPAPAPGRSFAPGDTVPGHVLRPPSGSLSDVKAVGTHDATTGTWTVTFERPLTTTDTTNDVQFSAAGGAYDFNVALFDNEDGWAGGAGMVNEAGAAFTATIPAASGALSFPLGWPTKVTAMSGQRTAAGTIQLTVSWADSTPDVRRYEWVYDGTSWRREMTKREDMVAIVWAMAAGTPLGTGGGTTGTGNCNGMCHAGSGMWAAANQVDLWHWQAARTNPYDTCDDALMDATIGDGRKLDAGTVAYRANIGSGGSQPASMAETDPGARALYLVDGPADARPALPLAPASAWEAGQRIPATVTRKAGAGSVADVAAVGTHSGGVWTVTFDRALSTADAANDIQFAPGNTYFFQVALFDAEDGRDMGNGMTLDSLRQNWAALPAAPGLATVGLNQVKNGLLQSVKVQTSAAGRIGVEVKWTDGDLDRSRYPWVFAGTGWFQDTTAKEDQVALLWALSANVPLGLGTGTTGTGMCGNMCHPPAMYTGVGTRVDLWQWRAGGTNPAGMAADRSLDDAVAGGFSDDTGTPVGYPNLALGPPPVPAWMADGDPGSGAVHLLEWLAGTRRAIPFVATVLPGGGGTGGGGGPGGPTASFSGQVNPMLAANCACHRNGGTAGGFNQDSYASILAGGNNNGTNPEVVPGNANGSLLFQKVSMTTPPVGARMPFGGPYLSQANQDLIRDWINQGALNN